MIQQINLISLTYVLIRRTIYSVSNANLIICTKCHKVSNAKKLPWITRYIVLLIRRRDKLHIRLKKGKINLLHRYKELKTTIKREMRRAFWNYIDSIISYNPDHSPAESRSVNKKFWSFISSRNRDNINIPTLKSFGHIFTAASDKAKYIKSSLSVKFYICKSP